MLTLQTSLRVDGISASEIFDFLANPIDEAYRRWWPGTHLQFHPLERHADTWATSSTWTSTSAPAGCG
jgi:hypothetical protein